MARVGLASEEHLPEARRRLLTTRRVIPHRATVEMLRLAASQRMMDEDDLEGQLAAVERFESILPLCFEEPATEIMDAFSTREIIELINAARQAQLTDDDLGKSDSPRNSAPVSSATDAPMRGDASISPPRTLRSSSNVRAATAPHVTAALRARMDGSS